MIFNFFFCDFKNRLFGVSTGHIRRIATSDTRNKITHK